MLLLVAPVVIGDLGLLYQALVALLICTVEPLYKHMVGRPKIHPRSETSTYRTSSAWFLQLCSKKKPSIYQDIRLSCVLISGLTVFP